MILFAAVQAAITLFPMGNAGGVTDEEKKQMFLKAREEMQTVSSPTPTAEAVPKAKPKAKRHPAPAPTPATPKTERKRPVEEESRATPAPTPTPERRTPAPSATPAPTPPPRQAAPVMIEKSGFEQEKGLAPAPPLPFWERWNRWRYISKGVREEIDRAPVQKHRWRYIVVHNSGTRQGNAKIFDYYHRNVRRMPNGLAYQFVIGNGTSSGNGQIEVGDRWKRQINGGHVHSDYLNNIALGICLVGDFNRDTPTQAQLLALDELIRYLRIRVGKTDGRFAIVKAHRDINPPQWPTDCPGDRFPFRWLYSSFK